jgi:sugar/nucleoside kinase (ribokinase family)
MKIVCAANCRIDRHTDHGIGALALSRGPRIACAAQPIAHVVDTTGAGDAFTAGFLCEYAHSRDVARSLELGTKVAASTLRHLSSFELD